MPGDRANTSTQDVIGLIPAAGQAARIAPLPCSKEVYPLGFRPAEGGHDKRPKVVCHYLLEKMRAAGIARAFMVLRRGKWDIPAYLHDGSIVDLNLAYLVLGQSLGVPYTIDQAYPFVRGAVVAFGFPDIIFQADDAYVQLLSWQASSKADVVLGLFPAEEPRKVDMVELEEGVRVRRIVIRPQQTRLDHSWCIAVWTPVFTRFLHERLIPAEASAGMLPELSMGDILQLAIDAELRVEGLPVSTYPYLDIGTPEDLISAIRHFTS